jgi:hypothetical protein
MDVWDVTSSSPRQRSFALLSVAHVTSDADVRLPQWGDALADVTRSLHALRCQSDDHGDDDALPVQAPPSPWQWPQRGAEYDASPLTLPLADSVDTTYLRHSACARRIQRCYAAFVTYRRVSHARLHALAAVLYRSTLRRAVWAWRRALFLRRAAAALSERVTRHRVRLLLRSWHAHTTTHRRFLDAARRLVLWHRNHELLR